MKYNELSLVPKKPQNRVGRGIAAGQGKTAGRGTKGQNARAGSGSKPGFEGGQNPLYKRIPKLRGFKRHVAKPITVTTRKLNQFTGVVDNFTLYEAKIIDDPSVIARVVLNGEVTSKIDVKLQAASEGAVTAIKKANGSFEKTDRVAAVKSTEDDK